MKRTFLGLLLSAISFTGTAMTVSSQDIEEGSRMTKTFEANVFGCSGENLSPMLSWREVPEGTKSFAITVYDPDAPTGSGFWHWLVIDLPSTWNHIERGASGKLTAGRELENNYGSIGFGGACPPVGDGMHRFQFTVWALPTEKLAIPEGASNAIVGFMLNNTAIDKATLTTTYVR